MSSRPRRQARGPTVVRLRSGRAVLRAELQREPQDGGLQHDYRGVERRRLRASQDVRVTPVCVDMTWPAGWVLRLLLSAETGAVGRLRRAIVCLPSLSLVLLTREHLSGRKPL